MFVAIAPIAPSFPARTLDNGKGKTLSTTLSDAAALKLCATSSSTFGQDLARKATTYRLSPAQWFWVHKLAQEVIQAPVAAAPVQIAATMQPIQDLFAKAQTHLKYPKVTLDAGAYTVVLSLAGPRSKNAGGINVTDEGRFPNNRYFGRIDMQGAFFPGRTVPDEVTALLTLFAQDPIGVAAAYGKTTGNCAFCRKSLTDARSTSVGYGPHCAKNFSLPWG